MLIQNLKGVVLLILIVLSACSKNKHTRFQEVSPEDSGLTFENTVEPTDGLNAFIFTNFYNGGGVAIADFNQDGKEDIFFTANLKSSQLYLAQEKKLNYKNATQESGLETDGWCNGVSVVDINQDGLPDLYISKAVTPDQKDSKNLLFVNKGIENGIPIFKEEAALYGLDFAGYTTQAAFFDYDLDGDLDVFLLNTSPDYGSPIQIRKKIDDGSMPSTNKLFRNEGLNENGNFWYVDVSIAAGILHEGLGLGLGISDINADGYPDIYCSNDFLSDDNFYLNKGDGTFQYIHKEVLSHTSLYGMGLDIADLNNDGLTDLVQLDMLPEDNFRQKMMLVGSDFDKKAMSTSPDFNYLPQYIRNSVQLNRSQNGKVNFSEIGLLANVAKTDWSWCPLLADFDNDGFKDLFISNGYRKNVTDLDFIQFNKSLAPFGTTASRKEQLNEKLDQVPEIKLKNYAFKNRGNGQFDDVSNLWGLDALSYSNGAAYADLDQDGDLDIVVNNIDQPAMLLANKSDLDSNYLNINLLARAPNRQAIGAKVKVFQQGKVQLLENYPARGYLSSVSATLHFGFSEKGKIDSLHVIWPDKSIQTLYGISLGQTLQIEKKPEHTISPEIELPQLFEQIKNSGLDFTFKGSSKNDFTVAVTLLEMKGKLGAKTVVVDLNQDGLEDIVLGTRQNEKAAVNCYYQQKNGRFVPTVIELDQNAEIQFLKAEDLTADGFPELLIGFGENINFDLIQPELLFNRNGKFDFAAAKLPATLSCVSGLLFDFDGDQDLDLLLGADIPVKTVQNNDKLIYLQNVGDAAKPKFRNETEKVLTNLKLTGAVHALAQVDNSEFMLAGHYQSPLLFTFKNNAFRASKVFKNLEGLYYSIKVADLDQDGDRDILLGNGGLNRIYCGKAGEPILIYHADFNQDGFEDQICSYIEKGEVYPLHDLGTMAKVFPALRKKFNTFKEFAAATFSEVYEQDLFKGLTPYRLENLNSLYLENKGNSEFLVNNLPLEAQFAPIMDFLVDDFNRDGNLDFILTGNFYANNAYLGPIDANGIQLFSGDGKGKFSAVSAQVSGLFSNKEGRSLNSIQVGENQLFLNSNYKGTLELYKIKNRSPMPD